MHTSLLKYDLTIVFLYEQPLTAGHCGCNLSYNWLDINGILKKLKKFLRRPGQNQYVRKPYLINWKECF